MQKEIQIRCKGSHMVALADIKPFQKDLKELSKTNYEKLKKSIMDYGIISPFFVWQGNILDGHCRRNTLMKMESEGFYLPSMFPAVDIKAESEKDAKKILLAITSQYNKMTEEGLAEFMNDAEIDFAEFDESFAFDIIDPKHFQENFYTDPEVDNPKEDEVPEAGDSISKLGDVWELGEHRVLCGDATKDLDKLMGGEKADMVFTDPPYGVGYNYNDYNDSKNKDHKKLSKKIIELCEQSSSKAIITPGAVNLKLYLELSNPKHIGVWTKTNAMTPGRVTHFWVWEPVLFYGKWKKKRGNDVFNFPVGKQLDVGNHTCPKPIKLWQDIVDNFSEPGETILDLFLGSGSTLIACEKTNRKCYGMELDPHYTDVIVERFVQFTETDKDVKLIRDGKTYSYEGAKKLCDQRNTNQNIVNS